MKITAEGLEQSKMSNDDNFQKIVREFAKTEGEFETVIAWLGNMISSCNYLEQTYQWLLVHLLQCRQYQSAAIVSQEKRGFPAMVELVEKLFAVYVGDAAARDELDKIGNEAKTLYDKRNQHVHSIWYLAPGQIGEAPVKRYKLQKNLGAIPVEATELVALAQRFDDCNQRILVITSKLLNQINGPPPEGDSEVSSNSPD
jgi:hypothetical protein